MENRFGNQLPQHAELERSKRHPQTVASSTRSMAAHSCLVSVQLAQQAPPHRKYLRGSRWNCWRRAVFLVVSRERIASRNATPTPMSALRCATPSTPPVEAGRTQEKAPRHKSARVRRLSAQSRRQRKPPPADSRVLVAPASTSGRVSIGLAVLRAAGRRPPASRPLLCRPLPWPDATGADCGFWPRWAACSFRRVFLISSSLCSACGK